MPTSQTRFAPKNQTANDEPIVGRPHMTKDYGLAAPNAGSGLMLWSRMDEKMAAARNYWVGTTRPDGRPHVMPVWGIWVDGVFYFSTGIGSRKERNLATNPALVVHLESGDDVVILEGTAARVTDPTLLRRLDAVYYAKYKVRLAEDPTQVGPVFALRPQVAFAWLETDFPGGATRWRFS